MKGIDKPTGEPGSGEADGSLGPAGVPPSGPNSGSAAGSPVPAGILVLDKPRGPSSMQAVARVRGRVKAGIIEKMGEGVGPRRPKVGHAGTLDPLADGVLLIGVGAATRELGRLMGLEKGYRTTIDLSAFTTTDDEEGEREPVTVAEIPGEAAVRAAVAGFAGEGLQSPPAYSAVKIDGRRAYAMARDGKPPDIPARPIIVHEISTRSYAWPLVTVDIRCGKGFYVRRFARDLGLGLGTGGTCRSIQRRSIGPFTIAEAIAFDALPATVGARDLISVEEAVRRTMASCDAPTPDVS